MTRALGQRRPPPPTSNCGILFHLAVLGCIQFTYLLWNGLDTSAINSSRPHCKQRQQGWCFTAVCNGEQ